MSTKHADVFAEARPLLVGLAYRMTGRWSEAEDLVQETYVRWHGIDPTTVGSPSAWLRTTVTRLAIDHLRSARVRRESYVGEWLPEPIVAEQVDPEREAALAESLSMALLRVLDTLAPVERAAFLLRTIFETSYAEIAGTLGRSEAACRQLVSRARGRVRAGRSRTEIDVEERARLLTQLTAAVAAGEERAVMSLLADEAILIADGGGKASAINRPLEGARPIARFLIGVSGRRHLDAFEVETTRLNGSDGLLVRHGDRVESAFAFDAHDGLVTHIFVVRNPDKLAALATRRPAAVC